MTLPAIPDNDADFTPDIARKIIAKYQEMITRLREALHDAPVLVIDEGVARLLDEQVCLEYAKAVREWHPKVKALLAHEQHVRK